MTKLLIVDDDITFCEILSEAIIKHGFIVKLAHNVSEAIDTAHSFEPDLVLTDLKMPGISGLGLIPELISMNKSIKIVVLTGYAGINTAIEAIKLGAIHYLSKPVTCEDIIAAFNKENGNPNILIDTQTLPLNKAEKEYINNILQKNSNNISATARELGMHRRTLQRKLEKLGLR